jgi:peptidoglycan/xylan/chitin deacetylase (PgdA/CDA1 family)
VRNFPIITFHSVDDSGSVISMPPSRFAHIVNELAESGWYGCTISEALATWQRESPTEQLVALCFDDGYLNLRHQALPVLREAGFTATVFVAAGRCGGDNRWAGQPSSIPTMPLLDWSDLEALQGAGWEIGSHGLEHLTLPALDTERVARELEGARAVLESNLATLVPLFAYPYGAYNDTIRELTRGVYDAACGTRLAFASASDLAAPFELPRIDAYYLRGLSAAKTIDTLIGRTYLTVRRWARELRRPHWENAKPPAREQ